MFITGRKRELEGIYDIAFVRDFIAPNYSPEGS